MKFYFQAFVFSITVRRIQGEKITDWNHGADLGLWFRLNKIRYLIYDYEFKQKGDICFMGQSRRDGNGI